MEFCLWFPILSFTHLMFPLHLPLIFFFLKVTGFYVLQHLVSYEGESSLALLGFGLRLAVSFLNTDKKGCPWQDHLLEKG